MKKHCILSLLILFTFLAASAETELESIWKTAILNNPDMHSAQYAYEYAQTSYHYKNSLYPLSLNYSVNSGFNDIYENIVWYPSSSKANISVSKKNPFGNSLSAGLSFGIDRGIIDYSAEEIDSDSIGYSKTPSANLSINQSLNPAIATGIKDPNAEILNRNILSAFYSINSVEKSLLETVTEYYIQIRCLNRLIEKYTNYIGFYELRIAAAKELFEKSKISISEIWTLENKKWEFYKDYLESVNSRESLQYKIKNLCGNSFESFLTDSELPDAKNELFIYNISRQKVLNDIEILNLQNLITRQDTAPVLTLSGSFTETTKTDDSFEIDFVQDKSVLNWDFSMGISFSEFFSPSKKLRKQLYKNNLKICKEKLETINTETKNQQENLQNIIVSYESQLNQALEMHKNRLQLVNYYEKLHSEGKCSKQELEEVRLNAAESECIYKNLEDNLWLYKWKRTQCK